MDVYSYGVLLCEMFTKELPDPDRQKEQLSKVEDEFFRGLIEKCIKEKPKKRLTAEEIIEQLERRGNIR